MLSWVPGLLIAINCVSNDIAEIGKTRKKLAGAQRYISKVILKN